MWNLGKYKFLYITQVLKINTLADTALQSQAMGHRQRQQDDVLSFEILSRCFGKNVKRGSESPSDVTLQLLTPRRLHCTEKR